MNKITIEKFTIPTDLSNNEIINAGKDAAAKAEVVP
tara:strand:+ start:462 stop:569 length:108 start_codon:yes stop_codon:yes gene_type:complete